MSSIEQTLGGGRGLSPKENAKLTPTITKLVPDDLPGRDHILKQAEKILAAGELQRKLEALLPRNPEQKEFDVDGLLDMQFASPAESIAAAQIIESTIEARWGAGAHEMHTKIDLDKIRKVFSSAQEVSYEFMPTKLEREIVPGGVGKLIIGFPQGAEEQDRAHFHPGGRIVIAIMQDGEFASPDEGRGRMMQNGTAILMPARAVHNFRSLGERNADTPANLSVDDILDKKVPGTVFLSFHIGYMDVESPEALIYVEEEKK